MNYFKLIERLGLVYTRNQGKSFTSQQIVNLIRRVVPFKESKIVCNNTLSIHNTNLQVSGVYDPELDVDHLPPIELEIAFPRKQQQFKFVEWDLTQKQWNTLVVDIACVLGHEFIHMDQFRRRDFRYGRNYVSKSKVESLAAAEEYYGIPDEVDAYAWTAAANMAIGLVQNGKPYPVEHTGVYQIYANVFDKNHPVIVKLKKKTTGYYKRLEQQYYATYH